MKNKRVSVAEKYLAESIIREEGTTLPHVNLYSDYRQFCSRYGFPATSHQGLGRVFARVMPDVERSRIWNRRVVWKNVRLRVS